MKRNVPNPKASIYIIHENREWIEPLILALEARKAPYQEWFMDQGTLDIFQAPPEGVFYNRMSASSHTRDHRYAVEFTGPVLAWLESHRRRVINNSRALHLEVRKIEQYLAIRKFGIRTPKTLVAVGKEQLLQAAKIFENRSFIVKPNRGGKGLGVLLFENLQALKRRLIASGEDFDTLDGTLLVQEYIRPIDSTIVRMEFIGGKFHYAVRVDASNGFELCPADVCAVDDAFCPTGNSGRDQFEIIENFYIPEIDGCEAFLTENGIEIAGIEFVTNVLGERYFYDINTNTNYNSAAESRCSKKQGGMEKIADFLVEELEKIEVFEPEQTA